MSELTPLSKRIIECVRAIPEGRVATYGQIAALAGEPRHARQVSRILHTCSTKYNLPWHRVIGSGGIIRLPKGPAFERQKAALEAEGVEVSTAGRIDLKRFQL